MLPTVGGVVVIELKAYPDEFGGVNMAGVESDVEVKSDIEIRGETDV